MSERTAYQWLARLIEELRHTRMTSAIHPDIQRGRGIRRGLRNQPTPRTRTCALGALLNHRRPHGALGHQPPASRLPRQPDERAWELHLVAAWWQGERGLSTRRERFTGDVGRVRRHPRRPPMLNPLAGCTLRADRPGRVIAPGGQNCAVSDPGEHGCHCCGGLVEQPRPLAGGGRPTAANQRCRR